MQLSHVTRFLAASLLAMSLTSMAAAQQPAPPAAGPAPVSPPPASPPPAQTPAGPGADGQAGAPVVAIPAPAPRPDLGTIQSIQVRGNQRIENGTVRSYLLVRPGDSFDPDRLDRSLKTLYSTGLFKDAKLTREGDVLVVTVDENPLVNKVAFEGNHRLSDDQLRPEIQTKPRAVFTPASSRSSATRLIVRTRSSTRSCRVNRAGGGSCPRRTITTPRR